MGKYVHNKTRTNKKAKNYSIRIITFSNLKKKKHTRPIFKQLSILPLDDIKK